MAIFNCMYYLQAHFQLEGYLIGSREKERQRGQGVCEGRFSCNEGGLLIDNIKGERNMMQNT